LANDGTGSQEYHVMLIAPDGQVLDLLECEARHGWNPEQCGDWHPFVGSKADWGRARGFNAEAGIEMPLPSSAPALDSTPHPPAATATGVCCGRPRRSSVCVSFPEDAEPRSLRAQRDHSRTAANCPTQVWHPAIVDRSCRRSRHFRLRHRL
jgi:hypothetical protein